MKTGLGLGPRLLKAKDRTGPDFQTLGLALPNCKSYHGGITPERGRSAEKRKEK